MGFKYFGVRRIISQVVAFIRIALYVVELKLGSVEILVHST